MKKELSSLTLGTVELNVFDIKNMSHFYNQVMGLDVIKESAHHVILGKGNTALISLHHNQNLVHAMPKHAGLYHFAILFSSRGDLARIVKRIMQKMPSLFTGSADHLVSEAFYFNDPERNGIELYYDRDRSTWEWKKGQIKMATMLLDPDEYITRYVVVEESDTKTEIGHIHLKVGDIKKARTFYVDTLGFTVTAQLPGALFVSVNGYHHHLGLNTWESYGALEREESLGLKSFTFILAKKTDFEQLKERMMKKKVIFTEKNTTLTFNDPWKNEIVVTLSQNK